MKKQASPIPTPRAAALSQSASRFSTGATAAWQSIAGNSPRLAAASRVVTPLAPPAAPGSRRVAPEPQRAQSLVAPGVKPETIRQVGWREVDRAVGMRTKRKYSLFGIGFGPKVPVVETEKVKVPVYQETDRSKRYYAVVKAEDVARVKREGLQPTRLPSLRKGVPPTMEQLNAKGLLQFFTSEAAAHQYAHAADATDYVVVPFVMPEYQEFTPGLVKAATAEKTDLPHAMHTPHAIAPDFIKPGR